MSEEAFTQAQWIEALYALRLQGVSRETAKLCCDVPDTMIDEVWDAK